MRHDDRMTRWLAWVGVAGAAVCVVIDVALAFWRRPGTGFRPAADLAG